jgi:hypothetical protein
VAHDERDNNKTTESMAHPLLRYFILPPVEKRNKVIGLAVNLPRDKARNDIYIYYLVWKYSTLIAAASSLLYFASYYFHTSFNFLFFKIDVWHYNFLASSTASMRSHSSPHRFTAYSFVLSMVCSYSIVVSSTLLVVVIPYAWLLFRANVDLHTLDVQSAYPAFAKALNNDIGKMAKNVRRVYKANIVLLPLAFAAPAMFLLRVDFLEQSILFFVATLCFYTCVYGQMLFFIVFAYTVHRTLQTQFGTE